MKPHDDNHTEWQLRTRVRLPSQMDYHIDGDRKYDA